jgi:hypothetical protein
MTTRTDAGTARPDRERRIPAFRSIEEEAEFWDTHDTTAFEDEFEDAEDVRFVPAPPQRAMTIVLHEEDLALLVQRARADGLASSELARRWIVERLRGPQASS